MLKFLALALLCAGPVLSQAPGNRPFNQSTQGYPPTIPIKGSAFFPNAVVYTDGQGFLETVTGLGTNCVLVSGGSGACGGLLFGTLAAIPATCTVGSTLYQATDQAVGHQMRACTSPNTWTEVVAGALQASLNLSDLANAATARTNLGLGTAAVQNVGAFLQPSNNLSDVGSASTSRTNLGLGTAATQNTGTSGATLGLLNGNLTFGGANAYGVPASIDLLHATDLPAPSVNAGALANGMTATTQSPGDNTTKVATDAFVLANAGSGGGVAVCSASNAGSPNVLTCTISSFTLATGSLVNLFVTTATTSGTVTLNINSGGAVTVLRGTGNAPDIGEIGSSGTPLLLNYTGTVYKIVNDSLEAGATNCLTAARTAYPWTLDINTACVPELSAANVWSGLNSWPSSSAQTLTSSSAILANGNNVQITAAGIITLTSTPTIAAASGDGTEVTITNTGSNAITLQDKGTLSGSLLSLGGTNIAVATGQSLTLRYNSTLGYWVKGVSPSGGSSTSSASPYLVIGSNSYIFAPGMMQASLPDALTWSSWGSPTVTTSNHSLILDVANSSTDLWSGQTAVVGATPSFELAYSAVIPDENNGAMHACGMGGFDGTSYFGIFIFTNGSPGGVVVSGHTVGTTNGLGLDHGANFNLDPTQIHDFKISAANFTSGNWVFQVGNGLGKYTTIFSGNITGGIGTVTNWFYGCENNSGGTSANAGHLYMNVVHVAD